MIFYIKNTISYKKNCHDHLLRSSIFMEGDRSNIIFIIQIFTIEYYIIKLEFKAIKQIIYCRRLIKSETLV
jgi:hypothetical protein